jgi:hypothetical protein
MTIAVLDRDLRAGAERTLDALCPGGPGPPGFVAAVQAPT